MTHHGAALRELTPDSPVSQSIACDWRSAGLDPVDCELCRYAEKLTSSPTSICVEDIDALRSVGLNDRAIHDACAVISYFNFVTRIAQGLGVRLERYWKPEEVFKP